MAEDYDYESVALDDDLGPSFARLGAQDRHDILGIITGLSLPPLHSDIIAKAVFNADTHPDRLNFLMRSIAKDSTIEVRSSASNEALHTSMHSKAAISDIPSWLRDARVADVEIQKARQDFIFTRAEIYAADMLILQYSVRPDQAKKELGYKDVKGALLIILMVESPEAFKDFDKESDRYIHRFERMTADTGLSYDSKVKTIYVQLDKCLRQLKAGVNAEAEDNKPDRLQRWLAAIADVNDTLIRDAAETDDDLRAIRSEIYDMAQDKEVRTMLIQERLDRMDWVTNRNEGREEGIAIGEKRGEVKGAVRLWRDEMGLGPDEIASRAMKRFGLDGETARAYVEEVLAEEEAQS